AGARSTAVTLAPASASWAVLPPGAAQRSATRRPRTSPRSRVGSDAAASWTHHAPSAKPGSALTAPEALTRTDWVARTRPPSFFAQASGSLFTVRSSAGSVRLAVAIVRAVTPP